MKTDIINRIDALRSIMREAGINAVIIPHTDPHQSEYLATHWQVRGFFSGFTGSAGTLVVTLDEALLWTDSRYFIQAADQLSGTGIKLMKIALPGTPSIEDYLIGALQPGCVIGIDGMLFSTLTIESMRDVFDAHNLKLVTDFTAIYDVWTERPSLPKDQLFVHELKYAGKDAKSKITDVLGAAAKHGANALFIAPLDEIAWVLNIRCNDVKYNPVATSYLYLSPAGSTLLVDPEKVNPEVKAYLLEQGVDVYPYDKVNDFIAALAVEDKVLVDPNDTAATLVSLLGDRAVKARSVVAVPKAVKNEVEIAGTREAMVRDGVALVKTMRHLESALAAGEKVTELTVDSLLRKYRSEQDLFFDESFGSIVGYGPHGAIVHYEPTEESDVELEPHGLLLIDSGAQYFDGTTDITRTIALGTPTQLEKHDFTLVLKGTIALASMIFPVGTRGAQLDVEARKFLWREGLTYLHGTGHGVGHFLNVHEGPQTIRLNDTPIPLMEGMITSDEPGLYRENVHGVRCENLILCVKAMTTEFGEFLRFETLTLYPFDTKLVEREIMTPDEIAWLNDYHAMVYDKLAPHLTDDEKLWLSEKTKSI